MNSLDLPSQLGDGVGCIQGHVTPNSILLLNRGVSYCMAEIVVDCFFIEQCYSMLPLFSYILQGEGGVKVCELN